VQAGLGRAERNAQLRRNVGQRHSEEVVQDDHRSPLGVEPPEGFVERIALDRGVDFDRDHRSTQLNSFAKVPFDDSGRFVLPERFFKMGGIEAAIYFQGGGLQFTIWDPRELAKMGQGWEDAQEACLDLAAKAAGGKGRK